ncbi:MAG: S8 family serine peptidase [Dehalococcoidia bacterium]|nr:S8 family serine peptidase [Dehalococcoidia bacterium]
MKRLALALLLLVAIAGGLVLLAGPRISAAEPGSGQTKVRPEVTDALGQQPEVAVIISLNEKRPAAAPLNVPALVQDAAAKQKRVLSTLTTSDFTLTRQYRAVPALAGRITARGAQKLAKHPDVVSIDIDGEVYASLAESVPLINADDVHLLGVTGEGVEVAVLDTGIDTNHPDLADDLLSENCFLSGTIPCHNGLTTDSGPGSAEDDFGHGSFVSGIITSAGVVAPVGVAPDAGIRAYKVLNSDGSGLWSDIIAALDHIIANHPGTDLINMSLGDGVWHGTACDDYLPAMTAAIDTLNAGGTVTVAASGNDAFKGGIGCPACISNVISVGMTYDETFAKACCSGVACTDSPATVDTVVCCSNSSPWLDLLAPGALITSSNMGGDTATGRGTSFAAPHVVGVAALLLEDEPTLAPFQLEYCLESTGVPITDPANGLTRPRVDALAALSCTPPPEPTPEPTLTPIPWPSPMPTPTPPPGFLPPYLLNNPNPQTLAYFGRSVAVGDVNGDGKGDIAVGASNEDVGGNADQGRAYVFSGATRSLLLTLGTPNPQAGVLSGYSVAVGDVNGDDKADIAMGAPSENVDGNAYQGRAYVFSGTNGSLLFTLDTPNPQGPAGFGASVAMGDVDGDGNADIVVGANGEGVSGNAYQGRAYVFSGADTSLLFTLDTPNPQADARFGWTLAVGDANGDGKADIVVGAILEDVSDNADQGRAYVFSGADGSLLFTLDTPNPQASALFGYSLAVGDVNGDGKGDIAVGARFEDVGGNASQGRAYVFSGADGSLLLTLDIPNPQANARFGNSVAMGDVDGNGKADIAVGADGEDVSCNVDQGRAYVFSGANGSLLFTPYLPNLQKGAFSGYSVAVGDVNGDDNGDIAVSAPLGRAGRGTVYVLASDPDYAPTPTPTPAPPVGGMARLPDASASSARSYTALAALAAAALLALSAGAWYARRRSQR